MLFKLRHQHDQRIEEKNGGIISNHRGVIYHVGENL